MNVALCCIGRRENRYAVEFIEYYKSMGIDKIFIYDNNYGDEEYFEDVLQSYVDDGFVDVIDFRDKSNCQLEAYQNCYDKHKNEFDWFCFFDFDEYITLDNGKKIKELLSHSMYSNYDMIHINWMCYGDNGLVRYEDKPLLERFKKPIEPLSFTKTYSFPENCHIKSIVKGGLNIKWSETPHTPIGVEKCCNSSGNPCKANSSFVMPYTHKNMFIRHFVTKTIEEYYDVKVKRGYPDGNNDYFKKNDWVESFFNYNERTKEKIEFANSKNLDIFICTHKDFKSLVKNEVYKPINCNDINNDTWNGLNGSFYSEIMSYFYIAENYELKNYIGFCHYRKFWKFMDDVPDISKIVSSNEIIVAKPLGLRDTVKKQYLTCHNIEDLYIVGGILAEKYPQYIKAWNKFINGNIIFPYNMFIMRRDEFLEYIKFIKSILDEFVKIIGKDIEKRIENNKDKYIKNFKPNNEVWYQYRIGGYLAERLTNVWIIANHEKVSVFDVIITEKKYK